MGLRVVVQEANGTKTARDVNSLVPSVIGTAGENLAAGDFVTANGTGQIVRAQANSVNTLAIGYVKTAYTTGDTTVEVFQIGENTGQVIAADSDVYLSATTPGAATATAPAVVAGNVVQNLGHTSAANEITVDIDKGVAYA